MQNSISGETLAKVTCQMNEFLSNGVYDIINFTGI